MAATLARLVRRATTGCTCQPGIEHVFPCWTTHPAAEAAGFFLFVAFFVCVPTIGSLQKYGMPAQPAVVMGSLIAAVIAGLALLSLLMFKKANEAAWQRDCARTQRKAFLKQWRSIRAQARYFYFRTCDWRHLATQLEAELTGGPTPRCNKVQTRRRGYLAPPVVQGTDLQQEVEA